MTSDDRHPVDQLAEEFAGRIRAGENPDLEDYCRSHPEFADLIRAVFPPIALVERASAKEDESRKSPGTSTNPAPSRRPNTPRILGDFEIVREIGRGGMGVVYKAIQRSLNREVALKVIGASVAGSERQLRRFRREAESAASLHHSNIVPVYGIGEDQGLQYYAMQLIEGVTLAEIVRHLQLETTTRPETNNKRLNSGAFCTHDAVSQLFGSTLSRPPQNNGSTTTESSIVESSITESSIVASVNAFARDKAATKLNASQRRTSHSQEATLRLESPSPPGLSDDDEPDERGSHESTKIKLSPTYFRNVARLIANVANALEYAHRQGILHRDVKPANLILDGNGTIWVADFGLARKAEMEGVTQTGEIVGTLRYMAPEQLEGKADRRTDVYALGITLYELLALHPAVDSPRLLSGKFQHASIPSPRTRRPETPSDLATIVMKACSADPSHRYTTARELEDDLRRFLDDRPIHARHVTLLERCWRWSRRNPLIASLASLAIGLLILIAVILGVGNYRMQKVLNDRLQALNDRDAEFRRAEQNLTEKTAALEAATREQNRAEMNLVLAINAFEEVFNNIAARGRSESLLDELSEDDYVPGADAILTSADVTLLETLLQFFDRLAQQNSKDLGIESAVAQRRVGDIQQQLGRLSDAESTYHEAEARLQAAALKSPDSAELILALATVQQQLMKTAAKRGDYNATMRAYQQVRTTLQSSAAVQQSDDAQFLLATTINQAVSLSLRIAVEPRFRPRNPILNRILPNLPDEGPPPPPGMAQRIRRELEASKEAAEILKALSEKAPSNAAYRVALAEAFRNESRISQIQRDWRTADESLNQAIQLLEGLIREFPTAHRFQYELADTLSNVVSFRPNDMKQLMRSQQLCRDLVKNQPGIPEYQSLLATTLSRIAGVQFAQGRAERAEAALKEAVTIQESLINQYPDVVAYQFSLARSLQQLAQVYVSDNRIELARQTYDQALSRLEILSSENRFPNLLQPLLSRLRENRKKLDNPR